MVQEIAIETRDYSGKASLFDVEKTIESAVNDFPNLYSEIDKLSVFIFTSKQIQEGMDIEKMRLDELGIPFTSKRPRWNMMYSYWHEKQGFIEVRVESFIDSSDIRRKFVSRHELGHIFLRGPSTDVTVANVLKDVSLTPIITKFGYRILELWKEFKVDSLMMKLFPEVTIQHMYENPSGFSKLRDNNQLSQQRTSLERLLAAIYLEITCEMELTVLSEAPSQLRSGIWNSIEKLHSERMGSLRLQASQIRPELKDVHEWFTKECLENKELFIRRALELSSTS